MAAFYLSQEKWNKFVQNRIKVCNLTNTLTYIIYTVLVQQTKALNCTGFYTTRFDFMCAIFSVLISKL